MMIASRITYDGFRKSFLAILLAPDPHERRKNKVSDFYISMCGYYFPNSL